MISNNSILLFCVAVFNDASIQNRLVAGATVLIVFIVVLAIVATVLVLRTKNQDDLDKKTSNHLPLPLDYASNEGIVDSSSLFFMANTLFFGSLHICLILHGASIFSTQSKLHYLYAIFCVQQVSTLTTKDQQQILFLILFLLSQG